MRRIIATLCFVCLTLMHLSAQGAMSVQFTPPEISLNILNTSSFDPTDPASQPVLATLQINNLESEAYNYNMKVSVFWNSTELVSTEFLSTIMIPRNGIVYFTNQDLITDTAPGGFSSVGGTTMSLDAILNSSNTLKNALFAGYFPDGTIIIKVEVKPQEDTTYSANATFTIRIRNAGSIFPVLPGRLIGMNPSVQSTNPVSYLWNSIFTGFDFNDYTLLIKEFAPNSPPTQGNVNNTGSVFYIGNEPNSGTFSDYLPYQDNYYYAWKVFAGVYNESSIGSGVASGTLSSNWYVFRFQSDANQDVAQEMTAMLNMLNNPLLRSLFSSGFTPTGTVFMDGRTYTGQEAMDLIGTLLGKELKIEISN